VAVDSSDPRPVLRKELARVFQNQRVIRAFEKIFDLIPPEFINQQVQIDALDLIADLASTQSNAALDAIGRLTDTIERLNVAPPAQQVSDLVNLTSYPTLDTTITVSWSGVHTFAAGANVTGTLAVTGNITATTTIAAMGAISGSNLSAAGGANPTALAGPTATNGVATTYLRSDGAPAINLTVAYTWTALHTYSNNNDGIRISGNSALLGFQNTGAAADQGRYRFYADPTTLTLSTLNDAASVARNILNVNRGAAAAVASIEFGNATDNPAYNFLGAGNVTVGGPIITKGYTVATLPAGTLGMVAHVTDALAPAFLAVVVGGGAVKTLVFYNGAAWVAA
jgi:hypothetical protein